MPITQSLRPNSNTPLLPTEGCWPPAQSLSRKHQVTHCIIGLASCIIGMFSGMVVINTPDQSASIIMWIVITGSGGGVGLINSSYILCRGRAFSDCNLITAGITCMFSLFTATLSLGASLSYSMGD